MTTLDEFAPAVQDIPKGWEPYAEEAGQVGSAIVRLPRPNATKRDLLFAAGFDPDSWEIVGNINVRRWMRFDQEWLYYYKFDVNAGTESEEQRQLDVSELSQFIKARRPAKKIATGDSDAWLFLASDWQIGKGEGDGTEGTVRRVLEAVDLAKAQIKGLRRMGRGMPHGVLAGTGDLGEGTCGFFANQPFVTDLNRREQNKLTRRLIAHTIDELSGYFDTFTIVAVGGNHGENRNNMKKATDDGDNDDVAQFECVREAYEREGNEFLWVIPDDELSVAIEMGGVPVGFTHGHLFSVGGKLAAGKALEWWKSQTFGRQAVADTRLLISSHFHHFTATNHGWRTHFQTPAMDPGSKWVRDSWGSDSPAGVLTMRVDVNEPLGWGDLAILGGN
jgi:hypothetical protein